MAQFIHKKWIWYNCYIYITPCMQLGVHHHTFLERLPWESVAIPIPQTRVDSCRSITSQLPCEEFVWAQLTSPLTAKSAELESKVVFWTAGFLRAMSMNWQRGSPENSPVQNTVIEEWITIASTCDVVKPHNISLDKHIGIQIQYISIIFKLDNATINCPFG